MLIRFLLWALFIFVVSWKIGGFFRSIAQAASGRPSPEKPGPRRRGTTPAPAKGELMIRDPVCGTFVLPSRSLSARGAEGTVYFCSEKCREAHTAR